MHDQVTFESRLADAYERYLVVAPVEIDAVWVATTVASSTSRRRFATPLLTMRSRWAVVAVVALLTLALTMTALILIGRPRVDLPISRTYQGVFTPAGTLTDGGRSNPVLVTLADGRVLIAGGRVGDNPDAKVVDPVTGDVVLSATGAPSGEGTGILLSTGRVLIMTFDSNAYGPRAYVFDPVTLTTRRLGDPAVDPPFGAEPPVAMLDNGRVLLSGGKDVWTDEILATGLLFDPETETFSPTGSMLEARRYHALTTLLDGRALVAGGEGQDPSGTLDLGSYVGNRTLLASLEIYDPSSGTFTALAARTSMPGAMLGIRLPDGKVLLAPRGGQVEEYLLSTGAPPRFQDGSSPALELFDPATEALTAGPTLPGMASTATLLGDGRVLLTGEWSWGVLKDGSRVWTAWSAIYDPSNGTLTLGRDPASRLAPAVALADGRVLFAGGFEPANVGSVGTIFIFE